MCEELVTHLQRQAVLQIKQARLAAVLDFAAALTDFSFLVSRLGARLPSEDAKGARADLALGTQRIFRHTHVGVVAQTNLHKITQLQNDRKRARIGITSQTTGKSELSHACLSAPTAPRPSLAACTTRHRLRGEEGRGAPRSTPASSQNAIENANEARGLGNVMTAFVFLQQRRRRRRRQAIAAARVVEKSIQ